MKTFVQIKAELFAGQHDSLIEFYDSYPRLFVNKLLLRLCEACMPLYPPKLAQFASNRNPSQVKPRVVAIRIDSNEHPIFWKFYKGLPYGAKQSFIVNLMNHYTLLAEADRNLLDNLYWSGDANTPPVVTPQPTSEPVVTVGRARESTASENGVAGDAVAPASSSKARTSQQSAEDDADAAGTVVVDPMANHDAGLL